MTSSTDFRPHLIRSQEWVVGLIVGVQDDQWTLPTPCTEFDVRALVEHLLAVQGRTHALATVGTVEGLPTQIELPAADVAGEYRRLAKQASDAWASWSESDMRERTVAHPAGTIPGGVAAGMYADENVVHGWDLAVATSQDAEAPAGLAEPLLELMQARMPAQRPPFLPFADAVEPGPDAGPTERLANWMGRSR